jgi:hypothetical protein
MRDMSSLEYSKLYTNTADTLNQFDAMHTAESYVRATSEESRLRALWLYLTRAIVERHGGTVDIDLATYTIKIDCPTKEQYACALEIKEQVGNLCWQVYRSLGFNEDKKNLTLVKAQKEVKSKIRPIILPQR